MSQDTLQLFCYSQFVSLVSEKFSGEILHTVFMSSDYKKRQVVLSPSQDPEILAENYFKNERFWHFNRNIFSLFLSVVKNKDRYKLNSEIHNTNTRQNSNLYQPLSNLATYAKWTYYYSIEIFNNPNSDEKLSHFVKQFTLDLIFFTQGRFGWIF